MTTLDPQVAGRLRLVASVVLVAAACGGVAQVSGSGGDGPAAAAAAAVRTAALACPAPVARAADATSTVVLAVPPRESDHEEKKQQPAGKAALTDLGGKKVRASLGKPGATRADVASAGVPVLLAEGVRGLAPGLAADLVTQAADDSVRGLAATSCLLPGTTAWFVGAGTTGGRRERLVLVNVDATTATLDLEFFGDKGPVSAPNSREITVPARSVREIPLEGMAAGRSRLAVGVTLARGRVAAALHDQGDGIDWIPSVPAPTRTVVLPGIPEGPLGRKLQLLAPGEEDAMVQVRLLTKDNDFAPAGLDSLDLPAGRVAEYDLAEAVDSEAVAVVVTADQPVLAAVRLTRTSKGVTDVAYATGAAPLTSPATLPDPRGRTELSERIMLTALDGDAVVTVRPASGSGFGKPKTVRIGKGRTVVFDPGLSKGKRYALVVAPAPESAPVYAARILRAGWSDISLAPVRGGRYTVVLPQVVSDVGAATASD